VNRDKYDKKTVWTEENIEKENKEGREAGREKRTAIKKMRRRFLLMP
jgi:hypothetical protein